MMKLAFLLVASVAGQALARTVEVADLPKWIQADTEVSTNCALRIAKAERKRFTLSMELAATPSNNVQVAFGRDVNTNGVLELEEQQLVLGWDCGRWVMREGLGASGDSGISGDLECAAADEEIVKRLEADVWSAHGKVIRGSWTENGRPLDWGLPEELPPGLLDENWNMLRLTVRGVDAPNERFRAQVGAIGTVIFVR